MENGTTHQKYLQDKHPEVKTPSPMTAGMRYRFEKWPYRRRVRHFTAIGQRMAENLTRSWGATPKVTDPQYFGTGLGIAVRPDGTGAAGGKLNAALAKRLKTDGTYQKISNQWFPEY